MLSIYALYAATEGHSQKSIDIVTRSVSYFARFLAGQGATGDARKISHLEIRSFILYLQHRRCFETHPLTRPQPRGLSGHTINTYLRSIRGFFSWLVAEEIIDANPFDWVRVPAAPKKVITTFSDFQIADLLEVIDTTSARGYRDYVMILLFLDTGIRCSELIGLQPVDVNRVHRISSPVDNLDFKSPRLRSRRVKILESKASRSSE